MAITSFGIMRYEKNIHIPVPLLPQDQKCFAPDDISYFYKQLDRIKYICTLGII